MTPRWAGAWSLFWPGLAAASLSPTWAGAHPAGSVPDQPPPYERVPGACARTLALARHPSFRSVLAARLVRELTWEELLEIWETTTRLVGRSANLHHVLSYLRLRAAILDELERRQPRRFERWYAGQWASLAGGRRA